MDSIIELGVFALLLAVGFFWGQSREKSHYSKIQVREKALNHIPVRADMTIQGSVQEAFLVTGNVVIANDFFKNFVASLRTIIGGRLTSFESLMDRARREAVLRMKEQAARKGATEIVHCRIEMSALDQLGVEIIAHGTAIKK